MFQGLLMSDRRKVTTGVAIARMWVHENTCVFGDRLINEEDRRWLRKTLEDKMEAETPLKRESLWAEKPEVICSDFMIPGADPRVYEEVVVAELQSTIEDYLAEYNAESKQPMHLVMFGDAMLHVVKLARVLRQPSGHALLLGVGGSGRQSLTRLATFISGYKIYQIEIAKGYGMNEWRENLKECILYAGVSNKPIVFLFNDTQVLYSYIVIYCTPLKSTVLHITLTLLRITLPMIRCIVGAIKYLSGFKTLTIKFSSHS